MAFLSVILDSCVIYPMPLCDTLLRAAEAELYQVYFSQEILDGATRNLIKNGRMTKNQAKRFQKILFKLLACFLPTSIFICINNIVSSFWFNYYKPIVMVFD